MRSMTGYAFRETENENFYASLEIRGYNSRFLDISVFLPPHLSGLERDIRNMMASRIGRGKVEAGIRFRELNEDIDITVNAGAVRAYERAAALLSETFRGEKSVDMGSLLRLEGILEIEKKRDDKRYWAVIQPLLAEALDSFDAERLREGRHTGEDILGHIGILESQGEIVSSYVPVLEASIKESIRERFHELLGEGVDENRVLTETAVLLMKYTISEELSRLSSHLTEFRLEAERNPRPGKKLDFLCQEINREINTIGSKTPVLEVSRAVVEMKNALENIREQLRNVE
jgi:uncharacterized protein (TIGR00255 family)